MAAGICLFAFLALLRSADWPQWRFSANRSAATEELCPDTPSQLWHLALPLPDPAYDHQYRMCAEITYAPVLTSRPEPGSPILTPRKGVVAMVIERDSW
jgi:hypothetical protein